MEAMGLDVDQPDSGCCGMAGSFGYEHGQQYEVSMACGERVILPRVRDAAADTLIAADGFSCREQIEQNTTRKALHFAQLVQLAMEYGPDGPQGDFPERAVAVTPPRSGARVAMATLAALGAAAASAGAMRRATSPS
jgi:hypothetical protein